MVYTAYTWCEHSMSSTEKRDQLNHLETQAAEANSYMAAFPHDFYSISEADARYLMTASHPDGPSPAAGVDAAKLDGYSLAEILAMSVPAYCIGMFGAGDVPDGYAECDGTSGTPNYQDYIPKGAGSGVTPGTTGGSNSITPTANAFDSADHTLSTNEIPKHQHSYNDATNGQNIHNTGTPGAGWNIAADISRTTTTTEPGAVTAGTSHKHAGSAFTWTGYLDENGASQAGALDIRPACRAVKFIMRLP